MEKEKIFSKEELEILDKYYLLTIEEGLSSIGISKILMVRLEGLFKFILCFILTCIIFTKSFETIFLKAILFLGSLLLTIFCFWYFLKYNNIIIKLNILINDKDSNPNISLCKEQLETLKTLIKNNEGYSKIKECYDDLKSFIYFEKSILPKELYKQTKKELKNISLNLKLK